MHGGEERGERTREESVEEESERAGERERERERERESSSEDRKESCCCWRAHKEPLKQPFLRVTCDTASEDARDVRLRATSLESRVREPRERSHVREQAQQWCQREKDRVRSRL